jgi:DNA-binding beta-propeller fold protein YncE
MARSTRQITSFFRWAWALAVTAACGTMAHAELLYVSLPQSSSNAVITYDLSLGSATAIRNSQQTFASGTVVAAPQGMAIDPLGNVFVADQRTYSISKFDSSGTLLATIGSAASLNSGRRPRSPIREDWSRALPANSTLPMKAAG